MYGLLEKNAAEFVVEDPVLLDANDYIRDLKNAPRVRLFSAAGITLNQLIKHMTGAEEPNNSSD